jgi:hypothetical protein
MNQSIPNQSQSQSYFTTGGLRPISSSWWQVPWDSRHSNFIFQLALAVIVLCNILSDERIGLSFAIAAGPRQRSHSQVRAPRDSWPHFTVSDSILPETGRPGPRIYIPQEQGGPVIHPGIGFTSRRLLRLAGIRWKYSTPPPHGCQCRINYVSSLYDFGTIRIEVITFKGSSIILCLSVAAECLIIS